MTLREKVAQINPKAISSSSLGGVAGCPCTHFKRLNSDGSYQPCDVCCPKHSDGTPYSCEECWSREYNMHIFEPIPLEENYFNQEIENSPVDDELVDCDEKCIDCDRDCSTCSGESLDCDEEHIDRVNESLSGNMKRTLFEMRELNDKLSQILHLLTGKRQETLEETHDFTNFIGISLKQKQNVEYSLDTVNKILIALKGSCANKE